MEDDVLENDKSYHNGDNKGWVMCGAKWDDPNLSLRYLLPEFSVTAPPLVSGHYLPSYNIVVLFGSTQEAPVGLFGGVSGRKIRKSHVTCLSLEW